VGDPRKRKGPQFCVELVGEGKKGGLSPKNRGKREFVFGRTLGGTKEEGSQKGRRGERGREGGGGSHEKKKKRFRFKTSTKGNGWITIRRRDPENEGKGLTRFSKQLSELRKRKEGFWAIQNGLGKKGREGLRKGGREKGGFRRKLNPCGINELTPEREGFKKSFGHLEKKAEKK